MAFTKKTLRLTLRSIIPTFTLLAACTVHADFNNALKAYQSRDGIKMMSEVKDAVNKKNNDGLMLFMNAMSIDKATSRKKNLYEASQNKTQTTLNSILSDTEQQELIELLITATNNSTADAQFYLASKIKELNNPKLSETLKTNDEYVRNGSLVAINLSKLSDEEKAEVGDPFAQLLLGLSYLRTVDYRKYDCDESPKKPICRPKDEVKGNYWLKQSLKNYESKGHGEMEAYFNSMCDLLQNENNKMQLRQAYLWCLLGFNSNGQGDSLQLLDKMQKSGKLKIAAPEVDATWDTSSWESKHDTFRRLSLVKLKDLPDWVIETRMELKKTRLPVFSYYVNDYMEYELDVYANGEVKIAFGGVAIGYPGPEQTGLSFVDTKKDLLMKVPPKAIGKFLSDLKKTGFYDWPLVNNDIGFCDNFDPSRCIPKRYQVTVRKDVISRFHYFGFAGSVSHKNDMAKRLAQVSALVERYFPTQTLRCEISASEEFKQACIERDTVQADLAKADLNKPKKI